MHGPRVVLSLGLALGAFALTTRPAAFDIRGTLGGAESLTVAPARTVPRHRPAYWEVPNGVLAITVARPSVEFDVGVVLTGPGVAESTQPVGVRVEGGRCRPGTVVVSPGTTLDITNADLVAHELYAVPRGSDERAVPAESVSPRARRQIQLPQAGVYELRDVRQPSFRCYVIAGPGQGRVLLPNATGAFAATGLSDGEYTVKVYYQGELRATEPAVVRGRDAQVQVNLAGGAAPAAPAAPAEGNDRERRERRER